MKNILSLDLTMRCHWKRNRLIFVFDLSGWCWMTLKQKGLHFWDRCQSYKVEVKWKLMNPTASEALLSVILASTTLPTQFAWCSSPSRLTSSTCSFSLHHKTIKSQWFNCKFIGNWKLITIYIFTNVFFFCHFCKRA